MNINDVKDSDLRITGEDRLDQIFRKQLELMQKYHQIERDNGFMITMEVPVNLHDAKGQYLLKDFAWRITEELGEALEALGVHPEIPEHYDEEIADALHFLVEFTILSGISPDELLPTISRSGDKLTELYSRCGISRQRRYGILVLHVGLVVEALALACNCLKNKPWKQTQMMTDEIYFKIKVAGIWYNFIALCSRAGIDETSLTNLYFRKSEVNKFRQRSNY